MSEQRPYQPSLPFRATSAATIGLVGFLSRSFLYALNNTRTTGLERFLEILDTRKDPERRERGLITVSNHVSVLDDPMIWGVLPHRYFWRPHNMRWSLGSYDICFKNAFTRAFFSYGQTLPCHRIAHSPHGGLFQPTITRAIRLLSDPYPSPSSSTSHSSLPPDDPFSSSHLTYTTTGTDSFPTPDIYPSRRHAWVHIFPEGMIHQHPGRAMRYFKWGVARLILESEPCPDVVPMWIEGPQQIMPEDRGWPRPLPRIGKDVEVHFGDVVDRDATWEPFRRQWREMKAQAARRRLKDGGVPVAEQLGVVEDDWLKSSPEVEKLRIEVTLAVREEVLKLRRKVTDWEEEDPKRRLAETWAKEGKVRSAGKGIRGEDGSVVREE